MREKQRQREGNREREREREREAERQTRERERKRERERETERGFECSKPAHRGSSCAAQVQRAVRLCQPWRPVQTVTAQRKRLLRIKAKAAYHVAIQLRACSEL